MSCTITAQATALFNLLAYLQNISKQFHQKYSISYVDSGHYKATLPTNDAVQLTSSILVVNKYYNPHLPLNTDNSYAYYSEQNSQGSINVYIDAQGRPINNQDIKAQNLGAALRLINLLIALKKRYYQKTFSNIAGLKKKLANQLSTGQVDAPNLQYLLAEMRLLNGLTDEPQERMDKLELRITQDLTIKEEPAIRAAILQRLGLSASDYQYLVDWNNDKSMPNVDDSNLLTIYYLRNKFLSSLNDDASIAIPGFQRVQIRDACKFARKSISKLPNIPDEQIMTTLFNSGNEDAFKAIFSMTPDIITKKLADTLLEIIEKNFQEQNLKQQLAICDFLFVNSKTFAQVGKEHYQQLRNSGGVVYASNVAFLLHKKRYGLLALWVKHGLDVNKAIAAYNPKSKGKFSLMLSASSQSPEDTLFLLEQGGQLDAPNYNSEIPEYTLKTKLVPGGSHGNCSDFQVLAGSDLFNVLTKVDYDFNAPIVQKILPYASLANLLLCLSTLVGTTKILLDPLYGTLNGLRLTADYKILEQELAKEPIIGDKIAIQHVLYTGSIQKKQLKAIETIIKLIQQQVENQANINRAEQELASWSKALPETIENLVFFNAQALIFSLKPNLSIEEWQAYLNWLDKINSILTKSIYKKETALFKLATILPALQFSAQHPYTKQLLISPIYQQLLNLDFSARPIEEAKEPIIFTIIGSMQEPTNKPTSPKP